MSGLKNCGSCGAAIVWLVTTKGKPMPVNADTVTEGDRVFDMHKHKSHFATCPNAAQHRRKK